MAPPILRSMGYRERLLEAAERYEKKSGRTRSTAANYALRDGAFFKRIEGGGGCTVETYERMMAWFQKHTPRRTNAA